MSIKKDTKYMRKHLTDYIIFQMSQGFDPQDIKKLLINYGYTEKVVEEIFMDIGPMPLTKKKGNKKTEMTNDLYKYLNELLIDFIHKEMKVGYSIEAIKKALINYGHDEDVVKKAIDGVLMGKDNVKIDSFNDFVDKNKRPVKKGKKKQGNDYERKERKEKEVKHYYRLGLPLGFNFMISIIAIIVGVFILAMMSNSELFIVFVSFVPSVVAVTALYMVLMNLKAREYEKMLPLAFTAVAIFIFIAVFQLQTPLNEVSDPGTIALLNAIVTFVLCTYLTFFSFVPHIGEEIKEDEKIPVEVIKNSKEGDLIDSFDKETKELDKFTDKEYQKLEQLIQEEDNLKPARPKKKKANKKDRIPLKEI